MSENINFIPAAELPLAEGMELETLCIENGELKRSANSTGGGYIIRVPAGDMTIDEESGSINVILTESYDNFAPILARGGNVWIDMSAAPIFGDSGLKFMLSPVLLAAYAPELGGFFMISSNGLLSSMVQITCPNGTWTPGTEG